MWIRSKLRYPVFDANFFSAFSHSRGGDVSIVRAAGWGSALVKAQLAWYGLPFETQDLEDLFHSEAARERLSAVNPLAQVPTLALPDGAVMTESAAITLHLADITGSTELVPAAAEPGAATSCAGWCSWSPISTRRLLMPTIPPALCRGRGSSKGSEAM